MTTLPSLTRRGKTVLLVAVLGFLMGHAFGGRNLNAVVVPAASLLGLTGVYVATLRDPALDRDTPQNGHQGDERTVRYRLVNTNRRLPARIVDRLDDGLRGTPIQHTMTDGGWSAYTITLRERGVHTIGPTRIDITDPLGLWERTVRDPRTTRLTVYPRVHPLGHTAELLQGYVGLTNEREHFDGVREYQPGDPLRDVNWKASAKQPGGGLAVTEYAGTGTSNHVTVVAESIGPRSDGVAEAAASVTSYLLDNGLAVELVTENGSIPPGTGDPHRRRILEALARLGRGRVRRRHREDADVHIVAPETGEHVEVAVGSDRRRYSELLAASTGVTA